jgi:hypothetical protein
MKNNLVTLLIETARQSADLIKSEILDIKLTPYTKGQTCEKIQFTFRGTQYVGELKGRNRDSLIGFGAEQDKAIVLRVILDDCATVLN